MELPFNENHPVIYDHFILCKKRLYNTFTRLKNNPADMITRQNFKNIAKGNVWWHEPSFLINDTKFNEKVMQPEILSESDIEI